MTCGKCDWLDYCIKHYPKAKITSSAKACKEFKAKVAITSSITEEAIIQAFDTLENIEGESSRNLKTALLSSVSSNYVIKRLFALCYDGFITYGITAQDINFHIATDISVERFNRFQQLCSQLASRSLSGNNALGVIQDFLNDCSSLEAKWYSRVLNRDLGIGVSSGTYGKIWPDLVSDYGVPKAYSMKLYKGDIKFPVGSEPKMDGLNISVVEKDDTFAALTRSEKDYPILNFIIDQFKPYLKNQVVVGELLADWNPDRDLAEGYESPWGKTQSMLKTGTSVKSGFMPERITQGQWDKIHKELCFWVHNLCSTDIYNKNKAWTDTTPYSVRRKNLEELVAKIQKDNPNTTIKLMPMVICNSQEELAKVHQEHMENNFEGSMIKILNAPTVNDRTFNEMKWKEDAPIDGVILEVLPGTGRNAKWTGSYKVRLANGDITSCNARGDKNRRDHWERRNELVGMKVEMVEQVGGPKVGVTRFIRFSKLREDLPKEFIA